MHVNPDHSNTVAGAHQPRLSDVVWEKRTAFPVAFVVEAGSMGTEAVLTEALDYGIRCETSAIALPSRLRFRNARRIWCFST